MQAGRQQQQRRNSRPPPYRRVKASIEWEEQDPDPLTRSTFDGAPVLYFCIDISCRKFLFFTVSEWQRKFQERACEQHRGRWRIEPDDAHVQKNEKRSPPPFFSRRACRDCTAPCTPPAHGSSSRFPPQ